MDEAGHTRVGAEIVFAGDDQRRRRHARQIWSNLACRQYCVGGGVTGGVILLVTRFVLLHQVGISGAEFIGEPSREGILEMIAWDPVSNHRNTLHHPMALLLGPSS